MKGCNDRIDHLENEVGHWRGRAFLNEEEVAILRQFIIRSGMEPPPSRNGKT